MSWLGAMVSHTPSVKDYGYYTHVTEGGNRKFGFTKKMSTK